MLLLFFCVLWDASHYFLGYDETSIFDQVVYRMQLDTDFHLDDEQVYANYINSLPLTKAISNYVKARSYEPAVMLGYGMVLVMKTPSYLIVPGVAGRSWKRYFMIFGSLGMRFAITRKELGLKVKHSLKNAFSFSR